MSSFNPEEVSDIFDMAYRIEMAVGDDADFSTVFNALLVVLSNGGRNITLNVDQDTYISMVNNNLLAWWEYQDDLDAEALQ